MTARFIVADVFNGLATLEDDSVDLVVTSPPFLALRSYLPADHELKSKEIGSESTPAEFIDTMLRVTQELRRVLAPHGSICVELGDTYAGSGGAGGDYAKGGWREGQEGYSQPYKERVFDPKHNNVGIYNMDGKIQGGGPGWPLSKSRTLIPGLYQIALAYGINPLTGAQSPAGQWRIRNIVTWARPNPPVGALKFQGTPGDGLSGGVETGMARYEVNQSNPSGAPLLDYWVIPPGGYTGSHYAVFPEELVVPCVKAMCPPKVCRTCGEPSRRITETTPEYDALRSGRDIYAELGTNDRSTGMHGSSRPPALISAERVTVGWSDCGHNTWRPGLILDPFAGSGTTLAVATGHGHDAIGIDIDHRNAELARDRVGPFLFEMVDLPA